MKTGRHSAHPAVARWLAMALFARGRMRRVPGRLVRLVVDSQLAPVPGHHASDPSNQNPWHQAIVNYVPDFEELTGIRPGDRIHPRRPCGTCSKLT